MRNTPKVRTSQAAQRKCTRYRPRGDHIPVGGAILAQTTGAPCTRLFTGRPLSPKQTFCSDPDCQRRRQRALNKHKLVGFPSVCLPCEVPTELSPRRLLFSSSPAFFGGLPRKLLSRDNAISMRLPQIAALYVPQVSRLIEGTAETRYRAFHLTPDWSAMESLSPEEREEAMNLIRDTYTLGLLERCHLVSITSLARLCKWLEAAIAMIDSSNALAFAAALRGYLEAASDANDVMQFLPASLRKYAAYFYAVIHRPELVMRTMGSFGELEQKLIHFAFAARRPKTGPTLPGHEVAATTAYIRDFARTNQIEGLEVLYAHLCELTHPAAASVFTFLQQSDKETVFRPGQDAEIIEGLCVQYEDVILEMVSRGMNAPLLVLGMLHVIVDDWQTAPAEWLASIGSLGAHLEEFHHAVARARAPGFTVDDLRQTLRDRP